MVGDNFVAGMYRTCFKKNTSYDFYMKWEFEVLLFCSSRYNDKNENMLSRLQITLADAINKKTVLPEYIVVLLDCDLIDYLDFTGVGMSSLLGNWFEWLCVQFNEMIEARQNQLHPNAKHKDAPFTYWVQAPKHRNFSMEENSVQTKMNNCLESVVKQFSSMRFIKLKQLRSYDDSTLVVNNRFTPERLAIY